MSIVKAETQSWQIRHKWFAKDDIRQQYVQYSYQLWGMRQVIVQECENGNWNPFAVGDSGKAHWFCQMNTIYHDIPADYWKDWKFQIEYCNKKIEWWTVFYWPSRILKSWKRCWDEVVNRFYFK